MDRAWWNTYSKDIPDGMELWTTNREAARVYRLNHINGEQGGGVSNKPNMIRLGGNSGYQAVGLALHFGAERVILLGYDMQLTGGMSHWHGDHKELGNPMASKMKDWTRHFAQMAKGATAEILNATRETALTCFERVDLEACLSESQALGS